MHRHLVGEGVGGMLRAAALITCAAVLAALPPSPAVADWKRYCAKDIERAMANLTVVWKNLNAKRRIIREGRQYTYSLRDSQRCASIWKAHIKAFQDNGTFVWWSRSAVHICEAGHRMSTHNLSVVTDIEAIGFWRRRQWRYQHCIAAGQRIAIGLTD